MMDIFDTSSSLDYEDNDTSNGVDYDELVLRGREAGWPEPFTIEIKSRCDCCGQKILIKLKKYYKITVDVEREIKIAKNLRWNRKLNYYKKY